MTHPAISPAKSLILDRRNRVLEAYRDGLRLYEIAEAESVSRVTIWSDLRWVHEQLISRSVGAFEQRMVRELQTLAWIENEATEAWEQSKLYAQATKVTSEKVLDADRQLVGTEKVKTQAVRKGQCGDPRFLSQIADCVDKRCKLFGLYAPEKKDINISQAKRRERLANIAKRYSLE